MALSIHDKKIIVSKINKISNTALSAVTADLQGVCVNKINELRKSGREVGVKMSIVQNTLLSLAIKNTVFECLKKKLKGSTFIAYSMIHPGSGARLFKEFSKKNTQFKITGAAFEGKLLSILEINQLADMPTYKEAIIKLLLTWKMLIAGKLIYTLSAIKQKKETS
ncbi:50S ribosomal protein L10 [Buchnera aphidicola str. APS (Acyrthosiphon pisum)]|uniref:Large ribosomal subunit protein uL10 n=3 Tax=Buchnera aphidicola TaxID=9 RepID=RL10_BUCAI|nr:50S ribosomal protein L10 [Buchnera aphidicola]B8D6V2.1 RecName: Full=Large ribosomal subunit protein uL10; AltName: Full=50S ribosomal protein L10 [Buchnera aphidicola str. Tuc7 (Acyrthosiphon pisum)]B8D8J8.1 RecName: Full=Large ribosomal subunit protein uL10; AltName: Full=50S ribosomal protein L10 [Buchnera aphidicola str. 5A (Acyrthosiphon pisum)]P57148.1 RecName: Full=Large ribosomal subunit protein uL10; AltName: Full=50S ribosomal protein L10 [Buchnera aphidicola str. APS (Acyrthosipho